MRILHGLISNNTNKPIIAELSNMLNINDGNGGNGGYVSAIPTSVEL